MIVAPADSWYLILFENKFFACRQNLKYVKGNFIGNEKIYIINHHVIR